MSGRDARGRLHLPEPVAEHFRQVNRLEPPADLMSNVMDQIEAAGRPNRYSWLPSAALAAGATVVVVTAVAVGALSLLPGPLPIGPSGQPTASMPDPTPIELSPPPLSALPEAGTIERTIELIVSGGPGVYGHGSLWVPSEPPGTLTRLDPLTGEVQAVIEVSELVERRYNMAPAVDDRWVWVSAADDGSIVRIDPTTNQIVDRHPVDAAGYQMIATGTHVYMTDFDRSVVVHLDAETGDATQSPLLAGNTSGIALTAEGLWVSTWNDTRLMLLDPATLEVIEEYDIPLDSVALTADGDSVWISGNRGRDLERFSIPERRVVARTSEMGVVVLDGQPWGLTFAGELVRLDRETLAWTAGRQVDMRGCDCTNMTPVEGQLYIGTGGGGEPPALIIVAP